MPPSSRNIKSAQEIQAVQARIQKLKLLAVARQQAKTVAANLDKIGDKVQQQQHQQQRLSSRHHQDKFEGRHDEWNALANRVSSSNKNSSANNKARNKKQLFKSWTFDESALPSNTTRRSADSLLLRKHARAARRSDPGLVPNQSYTEDKVPVATDSTTLLRSWTYAPDDQRETTTPPTSSSEDRFASDTAAAAREEFDNERRRMIESDIYEEETLKFQSARKATDYADKEVSEKIANTLGEDESESERGRPIANLIQRVKNLRWAKSP